MKKIIFLFLSIILFTSCSEQEPDVQLPINMFDSLQPVDIQADTVIVTPKISVISSDTIKNKAIRIKCKTVVYKVAIGDVSCDCFKCFLFFDDKSRQEIPTGHWELIQKGDIICK